VAFRRGPGDLVGSAKPGSAAANDDDPLHGSPILQGPRVQVFKDLCKISTRPLEPQNP
jgi:hypothetical protein